MRKSFQEFKAARSEIVDISHLTERPGDMGYVYPAECNLIVEGENVRLIMFNEEWVRPIEQIEFLEKLMYSEYYLYQDNFDYDNEGDEE
jgi:hypothetical protein